MTTDNALELAEELNTLATKKEMGLRPTYRLFNCSSVSEICGAVKALHAELERVKADRERLSETLRLIRITEDSYGTPDDVLGEIYSMCKKAQHEEVS